MDEMQKIRTAARAVQEACGGAQVGIILGSGLGDYADALKDAKKIAYRDIPGFPVSTVAGHAGEWYAGELYGKRVCMMRGRFHYYEGYTLKEVTLPVRVMRELGVETLIVTNAAGSVNTGYCPGDLMVISDLINMTGANPLFGANLDAYGPRFPDMSYAFDPALRRLAVDAAAGLGIRVREGVYAQMPGPCYETPAEIRMLRTLGVDAVGMSTVPEVIVARHCGMRVLGVSCLTNMAAGILEQPLSHAEVMETGERVKGDFRRLLDAVVAAL